jgi:hypothetical protein
MRGEIRFLEGRLRSRGAETSAPFPSAVVIFRPKRYLAIKAPRLPRIRSIVRKRGTGKS